MQSMLAHACVSIVNRPQVNGLAPADASTQRRRSTRALLEWTITRGHVSAERLGYVALPNATVRQVQSALR
jgi:hypothetical protein